MMENYDKKYFREIFWTWTVHVKKSVEEKLRLNPRNEAGVLKKIRVFVESSETLVIIFMIL